MNEYVALAGILTILLIQAILLWKCLAIEHAMVAESETVQTGLGNVGSLMDEALDLASEFFNRSKPVNPLFQQATESIPQILLGALMNKMSIPEEHGRKEEPPNRQISEIDSPNQTTEVSEPD